VSLVFGRSNHTLTGLGPCRGQPACLFAGAAPADCCLAWRQGIRRPLPKSCRGFSRHTSRRPNACALCRLRPGLPGVRIRI